MGFISNCICCSKWIRELGVYPHRRTCLEEASKIGIDIDIGDGTLHSFVCNALYVQRYESEGRIRGSVRSLLP